MGTESYGFGLSSSAFLGTCRELDRKWSSWVRNWCLYWSLAQARGELTNQATAVGPKWLLNIGPTNNDKLMFKKDLAFLSFFFF